jgi:hypothetical protein
MQISAATSASFPPLASAKDQAASALAGDNLQALGEGVTKQIKEGEPGELREKFQDFVGQTFFTELIKSLRTSQKGAAYFNGGRAEEIFQGQFDQLMTEHLSDASAKTISDPMFELFQMGRVR